MEEEALKCVICTEAVREGEKTTQTECGHTFHAICFDKFVHMDRRKDDAGNVVLPCAVCRGPVHLERMAMYDGTELEPVPTERMGMDENDLVVYTKETAAQYVERVDTRRCLTDLTYLFCVDVAGSALPRHSVEPLYVEAVYHFRSILPADRSTWPSGRFAVLSVDPSWRAAIVTWSDKCMDCFGPYPAFPARPAGPHPHENEDIQSQPQVRTMLCVMCII